MIRRHHQAGTHRLLATIVTPDLLLHTTLESGTEVGNDRRIDTAIHQPKGVRGTDKAVERADQSFEPTVVNLNVLHSFKGYAPCLAK